MAELLEPIRIGDAFNRTYRRKNADGTAYDLTGLTVTFNIRTKEALHTFTTSTGLTVTPLTGVIDVALTGAQTSLFAEDRHASSFLSFIDGGGEPKSRTHEQERIIQREDLM